METSAPSTTQPTRTNFAREAIAFGKSRADCSPQQIDELLISVEETENIPGDIVEVGSWKCGTTICMAAISPERTVYALDLFGGLPYGQNQADFRSFGETSRREIQIATSHFPNIKMVPGRHEETIPLFAKTVEAISLLFMDSDFYSSHVVALTHFWPLLSIGGVAMFHDFTFDGVQQAIKEVLPQEQYEWRMVGLMGALKKVAG